MKGARTKTKQSKGKSQVTWDNETQEQIQTAIEKLVLKNKERVSAAVKDSFRIVKSSHAVNFVLSVNGKYITSV